MLKIINSAKAFVYFKKDSKKFNKLIADYTFWIDQVRSSLYLYHSKEDLQDNVQKLLLARRRFEDLARSSINVDSMVYDHIAVFIKISKDINKVLDSHKNVIKTSKDMLTNLRFANKSISSLC